MIQNIVRFIENIISNTTATWASLFIFIYGIIYLAWKRTSLASARHNDAKSASRYFSFAPSHVTPRTSIEPFP